jgi:hypothetical protein
MIASNLTYIFLDAQKYWQLLISNEGHCITWVFTIVPQAAEKNMYSLALV